MADPSELALSPDDLAALSGYGLTIPFQVVRLIAGSDLDAPIGPFARAGVLFSRPVAVVAYLLALAYREGRRDSPKRILSGKPAYEAVEILCSRARSRASSVRCATDYPAALLGVHGLDVGPLAPADSVWLRRELADAFPAIGDRCPAWRSFCRLDTGGLGDALMVASVMCREGWLFHLRQSDDASPVVLDADPEVPDVAL